MMSMVQRSGGEASGGLVSLTLFETDRGMFLLTGKECPLLQADTLVVEESGWRGERQGKLVCRMAVPADVEVLRRLARLPQVAVAACSVRGATGGKMLRVKTG